MSRRNRTASLAVRVQGARPAESRKRHSALDGQRHALAATDTQGSEAFFRVAPEHFMQQADQYAATGGANGVAEGDAPPLTLTLPASQPSS